MYSSDCPRDISQIGALVATMKGIRLCGRPKVSHIRSFRSPMMVLVRRPNKRSSYSSKGADDKYLCVRGDARMVHERTLLYSAVAEGHVSSPCEAPRVSSCVGLSLGFSTCDSMLAASVHFGALRAEHATNKSGLTL